MTRTVMVFNDFDDSAKNSDVLKSAIWGVEIGFEL